MNKSLFQITDELQETMQLLEEMDGDFTPELEEALTISAAELQHKTQNYIHVLNKLYADVRMAKEYEDAAKAFRAKKSKAIERLENALLNAALTFGKIECGIHTVSTRRSTSVEVHDISQIPNKYLRQKVVMEPDKKAIGDALKADIHVPGASLRANDNLKIS